MRPTPLRWFACCLLLLASFFAISFRLLGSQIQTDPDLTAHEWGRLPRSRAVKAKR
jgi:hypothetical protein